MRHGKRLAHLSEMTGIAVRMERYCVYRVFEFSDPAGVSALAGLRRWQRQSLLEPENQYAKFDQKTNRASVFQKQQF